MRIISYSGNPQAVRLTAGILNEAPPWGKVYVLPVPGPPLMSFQYGEEIADLFRRYLAELVNEWLRCGKRVIPPGSTVWASGMGIPGEYGGGMEWTQYLVPEGKGLDQSKSLKPVDESDHAFSSWLWKVYWDYLWRFKPATWFNSFGEVFFQYTTPAYEDPDPPTALPPFLTAENSKHFAWLEAVLWFVLLLNSGHAHLLDRCQFCARYFVRARGKKRGQVYKRGGPSCGNCKGADSNERTRAIRETAKGRMLEAAARSWLVWKRSNRTPDRYATVARHVSAKCRPEILITTRRDAVEPLWVKRNEVEIVRRAEQLNVKVGGERNAKG